ncbi:MAG TPA: peptidoglycan DD-metalloendopeptidase family protein [Microbacteriaceae bacterium]|nr:peptidoglycan DD-metalloendopeptidase family protein [Microbacteriaceae bacterium]
MFRIVGTLVVAVFFTTNMFVGVALAGPINRADEIIVNTDDLDLPTWDDVQAAKESKNAATAQVAEIEALLNQIQVLLEEARTRSEKASEKAFEAEEKFRAAHFKAEELQKHADESELRANEAADQAASLVSQIYRSGGVDRSVELFLESDADTADALLDRLAMMQKATERNTAISEEAEYAMNNARSLGEQAEAAQEERERLFAIAEEESRAAAEAVDAARSELSRIESQEAELQQQLAALIDEEATTVDGYKERVRITEERRKAEEARRAEEARKAAEAARKAAEEAARREAEAARKAAEEAAKNQNIGGGGGGSSGGSSGGGTAVSPPVSTSGWVRPLAGGYRITTEWWGYWGHEGMDLAIGSGTPIYAAQSGQVTISGWWGGCGNTVHVHHNDGTSTRYCHMVNTPPVYAGQWVGAGQILGYVGTTGNSTGNHLHYETWVNGVPVNPRPFMDARGIWL